MKLYYLNLNFFSTLTWSSNQMLPTDTQLKRIVLLILLLMIVSFLEQWHSLLETPLPPQALLSFSSHPEGSRNKPQVKSFFSETGPVPLRKDKGYHIREEFRPTSIPSLVLELHPPAHNNSSENEKL